MNIKVRDLSTVMEMYQDEMYACEVNTDTNVVYDFVFFDDGTVESTVTVW